MIKNEFLIDLWNNDSVLKVDILLLNLMQIRCPIMSKNKCDVCGATGPDAHTRSYCPLRKRRMLATLPSQNPMPNSINESPGIPDRSSTVGSAPIDCSDKAESNYAMAPPPPLPPYYYVYPGYGCY